MDAAGIRAAIDEIKAHGWLLDRPSVVDTLVAAAEAHLAILPQTKMVEVWRVESAHRRRCGEWEPCAQHYTSRDEAERVARSMRDDGGRCVHVSGPHMQEVPA